LLRRSATASSSSRPSLSARPKGCHPRRFLLPLRWNFRDTGHSRSDHWLSHCHTVTASI
jgi:hypothetical protein